MADRDIFFTLDDVKKLPDGGFMLLKCPNCGGPMDANNPPTGCNRRQCVVRNEPHAFWLVRPFLQAAGFIENQSQPDTVTIKFDEPYIGGW